MLAPVLHPHPPRPSSSLPQAASILAGLETNTPPTPREGGVNCKTRWEWAVHKYTPGRRHTRDRVQSAPVYSSTYTGFCFLSGTCTCSLPGFISHITASWLVRAFNMRSVTVYVLDHSNTKLYTGVQKKTDAQIDRRSNPKLHVYSRTGSGWETDALCIHAR